jgi:hypothetical protein
MISASGGTHTDPVITICPKDILKNLEEYIQTSLARDKIKNGDREIRVRKWCRETELMEDT